MIFIDNDGTPLRASGPFRKHRGFVEVVPLKRYRLLLEVLLNDLGRNDEKVFDIKFNELFVLEKSDAGMKNRSLPATKIS